MKRSLSTALCGLLFAVWFVGGSIGCVPGQVEVVSEVDEKQYQLAQDYKNQGRVEEALSAFLRVIDARRDAPESHLEAGYIYLRTLNDPIRAIYHFDRFLQFKPQSPQAPQVRQLIETAQKEFARQLPARPYQGDLDRIDLMELVKTLKLENDSLKRDLVAAERKLAQLQSSGASSAPAVAARTSQPVAGATRTVPQANRPGATPSTADLDPTAVPRTYEVRSGDTLSTISTRFYGTPSRWIDIYQANRDRLASENALRVGQQLRIP